jgi:hypothetical protein
MSRESRLRNFVYGRLLPASQPRRHTARLYNTKIRGAGFLMGEAKRKRQRLLAAPCRCLSNLPAGDCCFDGRSWHRAPEVLGLRALPQATVVDRCYMKELGSCVGPISAEHLISESVIIFIKGDGEFVVSGLPWLEVGESKSLAPKNLTANCLCSKHNSALSLLDNAAVTFFKMLRQCWINEEAPLRYLISGHDLERWLLKTLKALAVSHNLALGRERLPGGFHETVSLIDLLDHPRRWPPLTGLYLNMPTGTKTENHNRFQIGPLYGDNKVIAGLEANILGLSFIMMVEPPIMEKSPSLQRSTFRPGQISVIVGGVTNIIDICWEDTLVHGTVSLTFLHKN